METIGVMFLMISAVDSFGPFQQGGTVRPHLPALQAVRIPWSQKSRGNDELREGIAGFYDKSSGVWEKTWGEHMHHGYYEPGEKTTSIEDHRRAQVKMIDNVVDWAIEGDPEWRPSSVVDVGCGIGGSTRHLARRFEVATGRGITLSPYQRGRAEDISSKEFGERLGFQVADALQMPFEDGSFDLAWSLESGEHMPDKQRFVNELVRVAAPGGRVIIVTWCHRDLAPGETCLAPWERKLLSRINRAYYLPDWCSVTDYVGLLEDAGMTEVRTADWTKEISPFWPAVIQSSLRPKAMMRLLTSGWTTIRGALAMLLMTRGYRKGLIVFGLITAQKPKEGPSSSSS